MVNPHNSPWLKPTYQKINDRQLFYRWMAIKKHLTTNPSISEYNGILTVMLPNTQLYIAKNTSKIRLKSHLDWSWYTPKTLAQAIDNNTVESYYEIMLTDVRSDPNLWKDMDIEMELKSFYAARANRASLI